MTKEKAIAYAEVYQIIQYLPEEEYRLIAKEQIEYIKNNMAPNVKKICTINTNIKDIELSEDYENVIFVNYEQTTVIGNTLKMKPYECVIYEM